MKVLENGIYREATAEEMAMHIVPTYKERIVARIRERYSIDDEIAILRQRDTKPEEFAQYNTFVETIKREEKEGEEDDI